MNNDKPATVTVTVTADITVRVLAEWTEQAALEAHVRDNPRAVVRAIEAGLRFPQMGQGAGWVDDNHEAYIEQVLDITGLDAVALERE